MAYDHVCNHKGLMLCVMLPNFNHSLKPALTLSTTLKIFPSCEMIFHKMALVIKSSAARIILSHLLLLPLPLSFSFTHTHTQHSHTHTSMKTHTHTHTRTQHTTH